MTGKHPLPGTGSANTATSSPGPACVRPNDESAGKRRSTRVRKSASWLKTTLVTAAWAAARKNHSYLRAQFLCIKSRRGAKKAILTVAASMLTAAFYMLRDRVAYLRSRAAALRPPRKTKTIPPPPAPSQRPRLLRPSANSCGVTLPSSSKRWDWERAPGSRFLSVRLRRSIARGSV